MNTFQVGTATRDFTPAYPIMLNGYSGRSALSTGILERLELGCLALDDGANRVFIFTCDMLGIQNHVCERFKRLLADETGVVPENIVISCTHTHFAPVLYQASFSSPDLGIVEPNPHFVKRFETLLVGAAKEALDSLRPATLQTVRTLVPSVAFNRRTKRADGSVETNYLYPLDGEWEFSPVDEQLTALCWKNEEGVPLAVLANFGCHPVTGTDQIPDGNNKISADYPYYLRQTLGAQFHCPVFFSLGAAGDVVPSARLGDKRQLVGHTLGNSLLLAERCWREVPDPTLAVSHIQVPAQTIIETSRENGEGSSLKTAGKGGNWAEASRCYLRRKMYPENSFSIPIQILAIGPLRLVSLPFEVLSEISLRIKARHPNAIVLSCCNGYQGYLPLEHEFPRGGYETDAASTHFVRGTADRILAAILAFLDGE